MPKEQTKKLTPSWELAGQSVQLVRSHFTPFIYLVLLPGLLYTLGGLVLGNFLTPDGKLDLGLIDPRGFIIMAVAGLWTIVNLGPVTHFELSATKRKPKLLREYYQAGLKDSIKVAVLYLIIGWIIIVGLIAFIVPGILALRMLTLSPYYLVDKKLTIIQAIKTSAKNSRPVSGYIWGAIGVQVAVSFAATFFGVIPIIGVILSSIVSYSITFLLVLRYRTIET